MKTITINGRDFEVITAAAAKTNIIDRVKRSVLGGIYSIYKCPSITKIDIYNTWSNWFEGVDMESGTMGCLAGGSSTFSIGARYTTPDGCRAYLYITKDHNRVVFDN